MPLLSYRRALVSALALAPLLACGGGGEGNQAGARLAAAWSQGAVRGPGAAQGPGAAWRRVARTRSGGGAGTGGASIGWRSGRHGWRPGYRRHDEGRRQNGHRWSDRHRRLAQHGGSRNTGGSLNTGGTGTTATGGGGSTGTGGSDCSSGPLATSIAKCVIVPPPSTGDYHQDCVDTINKIRADCMCLPPLARWTEGEACADQMAEYDSGQDSAHAGFNARLCTPGGSAQCECPGWSSVSSITQGTSRMESCLAMMWHEVDNPSGEQGHYQAMSSKTYTKVACGINASASNVWAVQNYSR